MNGPDRLFAYVRPPAKTMMAPHSQRVHGRPRRSPSVLEDGGIFAALPGDILIVPELFFTPDLQTASQIVDQIGPRRRDVSLFARIPREVKEKTHSLPFREEKLVA